MCRALGRAGFGGHTFTRLARADRAGCAIWLVPEGSAQPSALLAPQRLALVLRAGRGLAARGGGQGALGCCQGVEHISIALVGIGRALRRDIDAGAALAVAGAVPAGCAIRDGAALPALAGLRAALVLTALCGVVWAHRATAAHADTPEAVSLDAGVDVADSAVRGALCAAVLVAAIGGVTAGGAPAWSALGALAA